MRQMSSDAIKASLLEIADCVHELCEEHGLVYILQGGSLLGAVRHGGFIPWDHDFDIMMPRYDYDRLVENFDDWCTDDRMQMLAPSLGNSPYFFAKVVNTRTYVKQKYIDSEYCTGTWLDIFPLDGYEGQTGDAVRKRVRLAKRVVYAAITDINSGGTASIRALKKVVTPIARRVVDPYKIVNGTDAFMRSKSVNPTSELASYTSTHSFLLKCPAQHVFDRTLYQFEDKKYWGPRDYEGYLRIEFGDDWRIPMCDGQHIEEDNCFFL